jgi:hypothetical protein
MPEEILVILRGAFLTPVALGEDGGTATRVIADRRLNRSSAFGSHPNEASRGMVRFC